MAMVQKRQVFINAIMSIVQVVSLGGILFIFYRFLLATIGVEQLGVWSLVLATTAVTRISDFGLSASVVKFVAKYVARGEHETVAGIIQTAVLSIGTCTGLILLALYPFARWLLGLVVPGAELESAVSILPFALVSLWLMLITGVFQSGLDGYQRTDLRSVLLIGGATFHFLLGFVLVPTYGLMGLAYAQVIQTSIVLVGSWLLLKRYLPILPTIPCRWNYSLFREMIGYSISFQAISIAQMLYDPVTKWLLTRFGGLVMVGYYEVASRMVLQFRALIVAGNQVLVPAVADLQEKKPEATQVIYSNSYRLLIYLALPLYSIIVVCTPVISRLWIGHYEGMFVLFAILLATGWFLNTLNTPAYFVNLGTGELRWNTISHIVIGLLNGGLGLLLGKLYGGVWVVVAWVFSLAIGSSMIALAYHLRHKISLSELLPRESRMTALACVIGMLIALLMYYSAYHLFSIITAGGLALLLFLVVVAPSLWLHPMRKHLMGWIGQYLLK